MRKLILLLMSLMPLLALAQEEKSLPNTLVVHLADGSTQEYPLPERPEISFSGMDLVIASDGSTVLIKRDDIARYEFAWREAVGVSDVASERNVTRRGNDVYIANVRPGCAVTLCTIDGKVVSQSRANDKGEASVSLGALGKGIYLLTVNNFTAKIIKQ